MTPPPTAPLLPNHGGSSAVGSSLNEVILPGHEDGNHQPLQVGNHIRRSNNDNNNSSPPQSRILARFTQQQSQQPVQDTVWPTDQVVFVHQHRSTAELSDTETKDEFEFSAEAQRLDQLVANLAPEVARVQYSPPALLSQQHPSQQRRVHFDPKLPAKPRRRHAQQPVLQTLSNVTAQQRLLIPYFRKQHHNNTKMSSSGSARTGLFRRMSGRRGRSEESSESSDTNSANNNNSSNSNNVTPVSPKSPSRRAHSVETSNNNVDDESSERSERPGRLFGRLRERSRSRSRSRRNHEDATNSSEMLVAVTSCRSDGYYNQKAPGSTAKLPRKAPANLKLFHELAVGVKDAYAAVGETPKNPPEGQTSVLWEFIGNLDFVSFLFGLV